MDVEAVYRAEYGRVVAVLVRWFGDITLAEEAAQYAFVAALERWPAAGFPPSPAGWLMTTARRKAIDRLRREASRHEVLGTALITLARTPATAGRRVRRWPRRTTVRPATAAPYPRPAA